MRGGVILLVIALFVIFLGASGKFCCFTQFLQCAFSNSLTPCQCAEGESTAQNVLPTLPELPTLPSLTSFG